MKFTPSIVPKNLLLADVTKKVHMTFDLDEDTPIKEKKSKNSKSEKRPAVEEKQSSEDGQIKKKKKTRHHAAHDPPVVNQSGSVESPKTAEAMESVDIVEPTKITKPLDEKKKKEKKEKEKGKELASKSLSENKKEPAQPRIHAIKKPAAKLFIAKNNVKASTDPEDVKERIKKNREKKRLAKLARKTVDGVVVKVPSLSLRPQEVKVKMPLKSIRQFILYCLTEASTPSWAPIVNKGLVKNLVVVFAQGLDITYFGAEKNRQNVPNAISLTDLKEDSIGKSSMPFFASKFSHMIVSKLSGEKGKIESPISELLKCDVSLTEKNKMLQEKWDRSIEHKDNMKEYYVMTLDQLKAADYPIPPSMDPTVTLGEGWKETRAVKVPSKEKKLIAVDCEMVLTASGSALARVTLINEDGNVVLDEIVKPDEPVVDYLTQYSGITPEIMNSTNCSFTRAQKHIRKIVDHDVLLIGHSLDNDLKAMKLVHPYCADTSLLFDHYKGPPYRPGLKMLARTFLKRGIQEQNENTIGHDSAEDARATLDLFKLKLERGPGFGVYGKKTELIFDRLRKFDPPKSGAILESADATNRLLGSTVGSEYVRCDTDKELVEKITEKIKTRDFVLSKFRSLQSIDDTQEEEEVPNVIPQAFSDEHETASKLARFDLLFKELYENLPPSTVVVVMGGSGEVPRYRQLLAKSRRYHEVYLVKGMKRENIPEQYVWTPTDQKIMLGECAKAKLCSTFFTIKQ
ncbi:hypothetical protein CLU79DRAFT_844850 [Phycomyces nitens]|nr:hypothetical protein CLU79DRAFT_844850 [Phycomyces nitens]